MRKRKNCRNNYRGCTTYHPDIVERRLAQAKKAGLEFQRLPRDKSIEIAGKLQLLTKDTRGNTLPHEQLIRPLDYKEQAFITSERILCRADFRYYLERYHCIERDPGVGKESGIGPATLLESQLRLIKSLSDREDVCHQEMKTYGHTAGILMYAHKCRQVSFTTTARAATIHRMLFWPGTRSLAATLKDGPQGTGELYKRDIITLDNLPFWLKPIVYPNVKDEELGFEYPLNSRLMYLAENTRGAAGIGTGTQQDVSHLTEVPLWSMPGQIRYSFVPSLPKAISTLHIQEGTSAGKGGYWQEVSEGCRNKRVGFEDYIYLFVPWWVNATKYRSNPPDTWGPNEKTVQHAELVERTSPEFNDGVTYRLSRDQMFWWEKNYALHAHNGETASFLANYPCTPQQSFTNWAQGALPVEIIESMEYETRPAMPYEVSVTV